MSNVREGLVNSVRDGFIRELEALTRKYRISISRDELYGFPLLDENADVTDDRSGYSLSTGELKWVAPSNEHDWKKYSTGIIK